jgi:hypothetical protein
MESFADCTTVLVDRCPGIGRAVVRKKGNAGSPADGIKRELEERFKALEAMRVNQLETIEQLTRQVQALTKAASVCLGLVAFAILISIAAAATLIVHLWSH